MAHYGMLRDYQFSDKVDDIRGDKIYSADQMKLGKVEDVIFEHDTGAIRYLVVDMGHRAKVLVPSNHVFRAVTDEDSFQTDLSSDDVEHLPEFDEKMLQDDRQWRAHHEENDRFWRERAEKMEAEYDKAWHEAPVQHRHGSDRNITPDETPEPAAGVTGERQVPASELFPEPLADKFSSATPMTVPSTNQAAPPTTLNPGGTVASAQNAAWSNLSPSPRWSAFEERIRGELSSVRERCPICCRGEKRVA